MGEDRSVFFTKLVLHSNFEWIEGWLRASLVPVCISLQLFLSRWFLDGELVHQLDVSSLGDSADQWPDEEMYIILNNGQKTDSPDDTTVWPNHLRVDFIRLYQRE